MKITVAGGTGYAGSAIALEASKRGHQVTVLCRKITSDRIQNVEYIVTDIESIDVKLSGVDVVIGALSPRGDNAGKLARIYHKLSRKVAEAGARLVLVGGFSCLRRTAGAPRMLEVEDFPADTPYDIISEAKENLQVLYRLLEDTTGVDWLFVSPALEFSAWSPGSDIGHYRIGDDVALFNEDGKSAISGIDYARAVMDEIENPTRHRAHIGVAY
ncbi:NAD(P)-dependent oxidoreductase [Kosakonia sp. MUSA4]|uniref:NAD(P)-dependent oxidoreductase n=1 Tax=Kosakonia sp. MUSA4 TaxID=2067958 RepID=UPI002097115F|nr:NAD(P)H-binding protein [Kosakonia sp. MUSA4]